MNRDIYLATLLTWLGPKNLDYIFGLKFGSTLNLLKQIDDIENGEFE